MFVEYAQEKIVGLTTFFLATIITYPNDTYDTLVKAVLNLLFALFTVVCVHFLKIGLNRFTQKYFKKYINKNNNG